MKRLVLVLLLFVAANLFAATSRVTYVLIYSFDLVEQRCFQIATDSFIVDANWALGDVKKVYPTATALRDSIQLANGKYQEKVFVILTHGVSYEPNSGEPNSGIFLADGILWEEDFRRIINTSAGTKIVLIGACYGGGMIDGFMSQTIAFSFVSASDNAHSDYFIYLGKTIATYRWWYSATWRDMFDGFYFKDKDGQESRGFVNDNGDSTISPIALLSNNVGEDGCFSATVNLALQKDSPVLFEQPNKPRFVLTQNYPNPFNPTTTIEYELDAPSHVRLAIFNFLGQEVAVVVDEFQTSGPHRIIWNASSYPNGIYYCRLEKDGAVKIIKMTLLK